MQTVHDLQRFIESLIEPLKHLAGSTKAQDDLKKVASCLTPFAPHTLADFAKYLTDADHKIRTGDWPAPAAKPAKKTGGRQPAKPKPSVDEMAQRVMALYESAAGDPAFEYPEVDALMEQLKPLTVAQLTELGKQVDVTLPKKPKKDHALEEISRSIKGRRENWERTGRREGEIVGLPV